LTMPDAQNYAGGVCASGGLKILVPDAAQHGLIAHYTFDDNRAADSSGHGNHAKVVPNAGPGHGATGAGAWFDGVKSMEVPHIPTMDSPDLTVSFWLYLLEDSTNSYRTLVRKAKSVTDMTPAIMLLPNDRPCTSASRPPPRRNRPRKSSVSTRPPSSRSVAGRTSPTCSRAARRCRCTSTASRTAP
jgi:hypothetical protein